MADPNSDANLAALQKAEADLKVVEGKIFEQYQAIADLSKSLGTGTLIPEEDDEGQFQGQEYSPEWQLLVAESKRLKAQILQLKSALGLADTAQPIDDLYHGLPPGAYHTSNVVSPDAEGAPPAWPVKPPEAETLIKFDTPMYSAPVQIETSPPPSEAIADEVAFDVAAMPEAPNRTPPANTRLRNAVLVAGGVVLFVGAAVVVGGLGSRPSPTPTAPVAAATPTPAPTPSAPPVTETTAPSLPPVIAGPIEYASECNGECFMEVDPQTCDRTFHFVLALWGDAATAYEGKTAIISTKGPGLQPTYEVVVANGKVVLDAVAKGSDYGGNPDAGCGANASWTGLLTSVDGNPTDTPNAPT
jgi:hypothetical protein